MGHAGQGQEGGGGGARHLVVHPAEEGLDHVQLGIRAGGSPALLRELPGQLGLCVRQLLQKAGADGQVVDARELRDLPGVAEGGPHDDGLVPVLLVVVVDASDGDHARVRSAGVVVLTQRPQQTQRHRAIAW